jgi:hypothetical protein
MKWLAGQSEEAVINLERRHTIGGAGIRVPSRSTAVKERRKSKVRESRDESSHLFHVPLPYNNGTSPNNGSIVDATDAPPTTPNDGLHRSDDSTGNDE